MTTITPKLIIQFSGWILMRIPTDPDPTDEPRGVSGYTFAFGDEPDLNRQIYFQVPANFTPRAPTYDLGVKVRSAVRIENQQTPIEALDLATVDLLNAPKLENRNWTLTTAGYEPIVPFDFLIKGKGITLFRSAPLIAEDPEKPVWQISEDILQAYGAAGALYEPATIGNATGIWDSVKVAAERLQALQAERDQLEKKKRLTPDEDVARVILEARIRELQYGIDNPQDRRIMARYFVERFNFQMNGKAKVEGDQQKTLKGKILYDDKNPWQIGFWIGAWDPDALSAYVTGALEIPYES